jgi:hypothetical protein
MGHCRGCCSCVVPTTLLIAVWKRFGCRPCIRARCAGMLHLVIRVPADHILLQRFLGMRCCVSLTQPCSAARGCHTTALISKRKSPSHATHRRILYPKEPGVRWRVSHAPDSFRFRRGAQDCAYVCNMAVAPEVRRRGFGLLLLRAAEEVARLGSQRDVYLHLRCASAVHMGTSGSCLSRAGSLARTSSESFPA